MYEMLIQGISNKKKNRKLCVTVRYKNIYTLGGTTVTVLKNLICGMNTYQ